MQPSAVAPAGRPSPAAERTARWVAVCATTLAGLAGTSCMIGWFLDVDRLRQILPAQPLMRFNTALSLVLLALASVGPRTVRIVIAAVAGSVGVTVLSEYAFGIRHGIDQLLVTDPDPPCRILGGWRWRRLRRSRCSPRADPARVRTGPARAWIGAAVAVLTTLTLLAYAYNASWIYNLRPVSTNAMHTALSLLLLAVALLAVAGAAERWAARPTDAGTILTRRLLPVALLGLPILGALALLAQRHDVFPATTTAAVIVVACALVVSGVSWEAAHRLSRIWIAAARRRSPS